MAQVLTLRDVQRAKSEKGDEFGAGVVEMFINECDPAAMLPFETLGTVEVSHRRTNSAPTVGFRHGRGATFAGVSAMTTDKVTDSVWDMGATIDIDKTDLRDRQAGDILGDRTKQAVKGMAWTFLDYFINGDHATDPYGFEGIKVRLANSPSSQVVYGSASNDVLDVRASAAPSESTLYNFLDKIDEAIDALDGTTGDMAFTSADFIATLRSVLRRLGKYTEQPEMEPGKFGSNRRRTGAVGSNAPVLVYPEDKGIKWYNMGYKADQSTLVVGNDTITDAQDGAIACRPVYFVKVGRPYLHGIQQYAMETSAPMKLDDGVTTRVTIDWPVGLHHVHNKSFSVLKGVRVA